jgi:hypothetical protein
MSDPVTNAEIEDVLSSIRRLVSTDDRQRASELEASPDGQDRLVLTPSQRVEEGASQDEDEVVGNAAPYLLSDAQAETPEAESHQASEGEGSFRQKNIGKAGDPPDLYRDGDAITDAVLASDQEDAFEAQDPAPARGTVKAFQENDAGEDAMSSGGVAGRDDALPETVDDDTGDGTDGQQADKPESLDIQARIASVEAAMATRQEEWEPDGENDGPYAGGEVEPLEWEDQDDQADGPSLDVGLGGADVVQSRFEASVDEGLNDKRGDDVTPSASAQTDLLEADMADLSSAEEPQEDEDGWQMSDDMLDEETLRDMVSEIVRQELQGALGERITRNVRKLVRREIHRALASQEFE